MAKVSRVGLVNQFVKKTGLIHVKFDVDNLQTFRYSTIQDNYILQTCMQNINNESNQVLVNEANIVVFSFATFLI